MQGILNNKRHHSGKAAHEKIASAEILYVRSMRNYSYRQDRACYDPLNTIR